MNRSDFDGVLIDPPIIKRTLLFCVGRGGDPARHRPLLDHLADAGCRVIAPRFDRPNSPMISADILRQRVEAMEASMTLSDPQWPLIGLGHSVGATTLLILAGAHAWTMERTRVVSAQPVQFRRLALMAPATDFFRPPEALEAVATKTRAWSGGKDTITSSGQIAECVGRLPSCCEAEHKIEPLAGHFTFMNQPPPQADEPHPNRDSFHRDFAQSVTDFLTN